MKNKNTLIARPSWKICCVQKKSTETLICYWKSIKNKINPTADLARIQGSINVYFYRKKSFKRRRKKNITKSLPVL